MTNKDKELLIRDLSARLPYNVAINCTDEDCNFTCYLTPAIFTDIQSNNPHYEYKPYLFPLSSMTEEQREKYESLCTTSYTRHYECGPIAYNTKFHDTVESIDYLIENHFDYRGLIPMGLALDATGLNIY